MQTLKRNTSFVPFSFLDGLLHFFQFDDESRLEKAKKIVKEQSGNQALKNDWNNVANDIQHSIEQAKQEKEELYACEQ